MGEWEVWLTAGEGQPVIRWTAQQGVWGTWPPALGVLVVRYWHTPLGNGVNWGDGLYGHPGTLKGAAMTDDVTFARVLAEAHATTVPPSQR